MAGYSKTPLSKKLGYKPGFHVAVCNSPPNYLFNLEPIPEDVIFHTYDDDLDDLDLIHIFTKSRLELQEVILKLKEQIKKNGLLWISWPKKSSKVPTDLDSNVVRSIGLDSGLVDIKVAAIDEIWSGLKFVYRTKDR